MSENTILIVDDEDMILDVITRGLKNDNYCILSARSGEEGIELLKNHDVHLVISDQKMPGMTGINFLKKVKASYPDIITIIFTGYADLETAMEAINSSGVYKFMVKPLNLVDLKITIQRAFEWREMVIERNFLIEKIKAYEAKLYELEVLHPGITQVDRDLNGSVVIDPD